MAAKTNHDKRLLSSPVALSTKEDKLQDQGNDNLSEDNSNIVLTT